MYDLSWTSAFHPIFVLFSSLMQSRQTRLIAKVEDQSKCAFLARGGSLQLWEVLLLAYIMHAQLHHRNCKVVDRVLMTQTSCGVTSVLK